MSSSAAAKLLEAEATQDRAELAGLGLWPNPSVEWQRESLGAGTGASGGAQDNFVLSVPLVLSGRTFLESQARQLHGEAAQLRLRHRRALLVREAILRFGRAATAHTRVRTLTDSLGALLSVKEIALAREKAGEAAGYDTVRVSLEVGQVETELAEAQVTEARARASALALLPADDDLSLGDPTGALLVADEQAQVQADLLALERDIASAEAAERAAGRGFIPELTLMAGAQSFRLGLDQSSFGYVVGVGVPLPLFQLGQDKQAQARARRLVSHRRHEELARELLVELRAASEERSLRTKQLERHEAEVAKRATELRRIARASYQGGEATLLVLMDAERSWREAQFATAELSLKLKRAELDVALLSGRLDVAASGVTGP